MASAAGDSDDDRSELTYSDDEQQTLEEFLATHTLPQSVSVTRGSFMSPSAEIVRGDVILLRAITPAHVTLTFVDADTRARRELHVSPDIPVKFLVLPPKDSALSEPDSPQTGGGYRPISMVTYPTIEELLMDCPTYFEANATYDDPYLPGFSIKPGDKFRFVKPVKATKNGVTTERLQCRTESGEMVCLSPKCRGNFTVVKDDMTYTLRELINLAKVPRRLKLAPENGELKLPESTETAETTPAGDASGISNLMSSGIADLPLSFTGVITMSRPEDKLEVSPWDNPETTWTISVGANLYVKSYSSSDYEEPVSKKKLKPEQLASFVSEHEHKFPAQATLLAYTDPPEAISDCLRNCKDVIVHEAVQTPKLFVKDSNKEEYFCISQSVDISFVEIPRTLSSIFEMMSLPLGSEVRVLADVAADFPQPFVLRYGDVLRVTKHDSGSWKFKHSSTGDVPIVKCERIVQGGKDEKLRLPLDLDVSMVVQTDASKLRITKLSDIFSGDEEIPAGNVSVLEGNGGSYAPLPASLQLLQILKEGELVVSPLDTTVAISPVVTACAYIPLRHPALLGFKRKLEFPENYFRMPTVHQMVPIEKVSEQVYEELERAKKLATEYEDYSFGGEQRTSGSCRGRQEDERSHCSRGERNNRTLESTTSEESLPQAQAKGAKKRSRSKDRVRRLSRALNPKNWRKTRAGPEQEELPPPNAKVSGLLTLSLQPSQAKSNEYLSDHLIEQPSPTRRHDSHGHDGEEEDPYEDVNVTHPSTARSRSLQPLASDNQQSTSLLQGRPDLSASAGEISKFSVNTTRSDTGQGEGNRSSTMPPMFDRERQEIRPRPRKNRPGLSPHQSGDRNETERSREARSPEQSKGSQHSPEKDSTERTERKREMRSPGGRRSPGHSTQRSPDSQSHRSPEHMRQSRSPESLSRDKHTRPKPRQSPEKPSQGNNGSEATSRDGRARPRQTQSSEIHTSSSRERESPAASGRKDRSRPVKSGHPETLSPKSSPQDRPEKDEKQALSSVEHAYENAWQARSSPKPSPRMRHGKSDLRQSPDRAKEFQDVEEKSEGSPEIKPDRPVRPRRERGGERRSPRKPAEDTAHISSSDSCPSELFEKSRGPQSAEDIPRTGDWSESTQAKSTDSSTNSKSPPREKARGRRVRSPNGATAPRRPQRQAVAVTESDSSEKESSRKGPSTDSTESGADGSDTNHKTSRDTRDNSKGRSPILMKPSVPPKPKYTPKQQAPMQFLMGPPPPTAPPRKRAARIGSVEAEMFSEGSAAKPRLFGRKQAQ